MRAVRFSTQSDSPEIGAWFEWRLHKGNRLYKKNKWPRKHTENTEYSQIISVSSVDSVAIFHDFDLVFIHK
jgi:hypothetical protein